MSFLMEFRVLGPVEVVRRDRPVIIPRPRHRALLGLLLLHRGRFLPMARIIEDLWGGAPPATAKAQVQSSVSTLRAVLGSDAGLEHDRVAGYSLRLANDQVDLGQFEANAAAARRSHGLEITAGLLRTALDRWRGQALAGVDAFYAESARAVLEERRLVVVEELHTVSLRLARAAEAIGELMTVVGQHPLRERARCLLMIALFLEGRQAEAMQVYRDGRTVLLEQHGLDPSPLHEEIGQAILADDREAFSPSALERWWPGGEFRLVVEATKGSAAAAVPRQLPRDTTQFTGRLAEMSMLTTAHADGEIGALVAVSGTAGVGKTALAVHWAHQVLPLFPDGQLYANLRGFDVSDRPVKAADAIRGFLDALQVPAGQIPAHPEAQVALYRSLMADRRMLVVLDNVHNADQVRPLLPGSPTVMVVVTSRNRLTSLVAVEGAHPLQVPVLSTGEARDVLAGRIGLERLAADPAATDRIIERCARLPLALAVVAARAMLDPRLPLDSLAPAGTEDGAALDALNAGDEISDLRSVFSWSYRYLGRPAARLFRLIGRLPGPDFSPATAASFAGVELPTVRRQLDELAEAHLITETRPGRYSVHDLLRAYATELHRDVDAAADQKTADRRLLDHYLLTARQATLKIDPHWDRIPLEDVASAVSPESLIDQDQAMHWFEAEHASLKATVAYAAANGFNARAWRLGCTLTTYFNRRGYWSDWAETLDIALVAATASGDLHAQALTHRNLAGAMMRLERYPDAQAHLRKAVAAFEALDDLQGQAQAHVNLARVAGKLDDNQQAVHHARLAVTIFRGAGHLIALARALNTLGWFQTLLDRHHAAIESCGEALTLMRELDDPNGEASTLDSLGYAHRRLGRYPEAERYFERAVELFERSGDRHGQADSLLHLADTRQAVGRTDGARRARLAALALLEEIGHPDAEQVRRLCVLAS